MFLRGLSAQMSCSATMLQGYLCLTGGSNELISAAAFFFFSLPPSAAETI